MAREKRWHHASTSGVQERILDAALAAFQEKGYSGTTMAEVVARADVSIGSVYHHFGGKDELFAACYDRLRDALRSAVDIDAESGLPAGDSWEVDYLGGIWERRDECLVFLGQDTPPAFDLNLRVARFYSDLGIHTARILASMLLESMRIISEAESEDEAGDVIESTVKLLNVVRAVGFG